MYNFFVGFKQMNVAVTSKKSNFEILIAIGVYLKVEKEKYLDF